MRIVLYDGSCAVGKSGELELSPSGHFRLTIPGRALASAGHEVYTAKTLTFDKPTGRFAGVLPDGEVITGADVILTKYAITATLTLIFNPAARRNGQVVIHDLCDWTPMLDGYPGMHPFEPVGWRALHNRADAIFVPNEYLARRYGKHLKTPIITIPTAYDLTAWDGIPPEDVTDGPVLGWTGVPGFRPGDLELLKGWLASFMEKHDLRLIHVGGTKHLNPAMNISFATAAGLDPDRVEVRGYVPAADLPRSGRMNGIDIGVVPMANTAVNHARTPCKGMDFVHRGIPFVASPSDPYKALGAGRMAGTSLADQSPSQWIDELERLLDPQERRRAAQADAEAVDWDIRDHWQVWESTLSEMVERRTR